MRNPWLVALIAPLPLFFGYACGGATAIPAATGSPTPSSSLFGGTDLAWIELAIALDQQVLPLLGPEWQSRQPEVALLDANARFAVAALWAKIGASSSASRMLDDIDRRYKGRGEMLVGYPIGGQSTLKEAVARLRSRNGWSG